MISDILNLNNSYWLAPPKILNKPATKLQSPFHSPVQSPKKKPTATLLVSPEQSPIKQVQTQALSPVKPTSVALAVAIAAKENSPVKLSLASTNILPHFESYTKMADLAYLLCNESGQTETLSCLQRRSRIPNSLHIGWSCWFNYDLIAVRQPSFAIICDININLIDILEHIQYFCLRDSKKEDFVKHLIPLTKNAIGGDRLQEELNRPGSWVSSNKSYEIVRKMYSENRIVHRILDVLDTPQFEVLKLWAAANSLEIDTVYPSNIREWMHNETAKEATFVKNMRMLIGDSTHYIDACRTYAYSGGPSQRCAVGEIPNILYQKRRITTEAMQQPAASRRKLFLQQH